MAKITRWGDSAIEIPEGTLTRKGPWTVEEDLQLSSYIYLHGQGRWSFLAKAAGLNRTGRSCRLRWMNYLRPDLKRSDITPEEERLITELHGRWGNKWSRIARSFPGRTDNEIKNYWRTRTKKKVHLQENSSSISTDALNLVQFEPSMDSHSLTTSSPDIDSAEPPSFPTQNADKVAVQTNDIPYLRNDILPQLIPSMEMNYQHGSDEEIHGSQINDDGHTRAVLQEHLEGSDDPFGRRSPYNFSVDSLAAMLSPELCADGAIQYGTMPPSPQTFSQTESYLNCSWDVLWNDE